MNRIRIKNVGKQFGQVKALQNISLEFQFGKIYGLLGRNGAGKTTLLNIITNRIFADGGEVLINEIPAQENDRAQGQIYFMSEKNYYPDSLKVSDVFKWTKEFYGGFDSEYALRLSEQFSLDTGKKLRQLSTGYNSIFKIITALSVDVPYVLLDEPVLGLDANHRELFYRSLLEAYSEKPRTFVISTHLIEEISGLIEEIVIIKNGQIIKNQSCEELLAAGYTATGAISVVDRFIAGKHVIGEDVLGGLKSVYILGSLDRSSLPVGIEVSKLDLQKLFIQLTNA